MDDERLVVALEARIRDFEKNMAKAERRGTRSYQNLRRGSRLSTTAMERDMVRSTTRINQALATTSSRIGAFGKAFAAGAVAAGMAAITTGATRAVRSMAEIDREAKRAGLSVTAFQELKFVSEQNRIEVDQMVDGLKELQLRADEFVVTGKGPAAEAFARLGYGATDLKRRLEDPEELFTDIIGRMKDLDRAGQIRVADEVFGGTAGERFVELLSLGADGLRRMRERAHDVGAVMDSEAIAKAAELDRKFAEITQRVANLGKSIVVNIAGGIEEALTIDVDEIFGSAERAIAMMGEENYRAMKASDEATEAHAGTIEDLQATYEELFRAINAATGPDGIRLMDVADIDQAHDLAAILQEIEGKMRAFQAGEASAEDFEDAVSDLISEAEDLIGELSEVDAQRFGNVIDAIGGIANALATATRNAMTLRGSLPEGDPNLVDYGPQNGRKPAVTIRPNKYAPTTSLRPRLPGVDSSFGNTVDRAGGGGGGRADVDEFRKEVEKTRAAIAQLEAEAVALSAVAVSGYEFGDALDYARKKAELLYEAQEAGKELTPELRSEIDTLAQSYARAGNAASDAADRLSDVAENAATGADAMSDLFLGILDGSMSAEEALKRLVVQLIEAQVRSAFLGIADGGGGGGIFAAIGSLLTGGRATGGPVLAGSAYMVNERTPRSEIFVPGQNGAVLNVPQAQAALRQQTAQTVVAPQNGPTVEQHIHLSPGLQETVLAEVMRAAPSIRDAAVAAIKDERRRRGRNWA
ncbi:hypothetical protein [Roseovarius pacificus]|uniref:hypothetical protein n=1 Tax=Roseovarius pacificus TaxID=337701 RepID=UPI002A187AC8|nr:hypothetical protein [Roseovarius pacificus]